MFKKKSLLSLCNSHLILTTALVNKMESIHIMESEDYHCSSTLIPFHFVGTVLVFHARISGRISTMKPALCWTRGLKGIQHFDGIRSNVSTDNGNKLDGSCASGTDWGEMWREADIPQEELRTPPVWTRRSWEPEDSHSASSCSIHSKRYIHENSNCEESFFRLAAAHQTVWCTTVWQRETKNQMH